MAHPHSGGEAAPTCRGGLGMETKTMTLLPDTSRQAPIAAIAAGGDPGGINRCAFDQTVRLWLSRLKGGDRSSKPAFSQA